MINIKNLSFGYGKRKIYDNFNLSIPEGQVCLITGINGVGKSTLLYLIADVLKPAAGKIEFNGVMGENPKKRLALSRTN